jgi:hypothetical protein
MIGVFSRSNIQVSIRLLHSSNFVSFDISLRSTDSILSRSEDQDRPQLLKIYLIRVTCGEQYLEDGLFLKDTRGLLFS